MQSNKKGSSQKNNRQKGLVGKKKSAKFFSLQNIFSPLAKIWSLFADLFFLPIRYYKIF